MSPERIKVVREGLAHARALVRRGKVPATFLARMSDLDKRDHAWLSSEAPDVTEGLLTLARELRLMRSKKAHDRETWGLER